jgi:hypothetical protein
MHDPYPCGEYKAKEYNSILLMAFWIDSMLRIVKTILFKALSQLEPNESHVLIDYPNYHHLDPLKKHALTTCCYKYIRTHTNSITGIIDVYDKEELLEEFMMSWHYVIFVNYVAMQRRCY